VIARAAPAVAVALAAILGACGGAATPPSPVPIADRQIEVLELPGSPDWLVAAFGSVWAKRDDGDVLRIDPASHEVLATIAADVTGPELCQGIGADATSIWACSMSDIVRIDPTTNEVVDVVKAGKIAVQGRLVSSAGRIWIIAGTNADQLVGVDSSSHGLGEPIALGETCTDLAAGADAVWAVCPDQGHLLRIDPTSGAMTDPIKVRGAGQVSVGVDAAWVIGLDGIVRVDLKDHATRVVAPGLAPVGFGSIWASADAVWVRAETPFLTRIDPTTGRVVEQIAAADWDSGGDVIGLDATLWASDSDNNVIVHIRAAAP